MSAKWERIGSALLVAALGVGCTTRAVKEDPKPTLEAPAGWSSAPEGAEARPRDEVDAWWRSFNDPQLNALMDKALEENLDLAAAWTRLEQAETAVDTQDARYWPQVNFQASAGQTRIDVRDFNSATTTNYAVSVPATWELDLWGRVSSNVRASELELEAARDDISGIAVSLAATVAEDWFSVLEVRARRRLLAEQLKLNEEWLGLLEARFGYGTASALDLLQQQEAIQGIKAQLTLLEAQEQGALNRLAVLTGQVPGRMGVDVSGGEALPELPPLPDTGVPADLLEQRPDLRAARRRVEAADHRASAALAEYLPTLRLTGSVGLQAMELSNLLDTLISSITASLGMPLLDGGGRDATLKRAESVWRGLLLQYSQSFIGAVRDVETAMVLERQQRANLAELERQAELSRASLEAARRRYRDGGEDFLRVLTALTSVQRSELNLLAARRQLLSHRIQLYRALGGSFGDQLERPTGAEAR